MNYEIINLQEKTVVGLKARTKNSDENMPKVIGGLWNSFYNGVYQSIENKLNQKSIGLYSNYEQGYIGEYDITVCCEVENKTNISNDLVLTTIPSGLYAKFIVHGNVQTAVCEFWEQVWLMPLDRKFSFDFEEYQGGTDMDNAEIHIYIALNSEKEVDMSTVNKCQSCGIPLIYDFQKGTRTDGSLCEDYCTHCYQNGKFTSECTMEEMIEFCIPFEIKSGVYKDENTAREQMTHYFKTLKRWAK